MFVSQDWFVRSVSVNLINIQMSNILFMKTLYMR